MVTMQGTILLSFHALQYLNNYLDTCNATKDSDGIGKACDAIAKSYARFVKYAILIYCRWFFSSKSL